MKKVFMTIGVLVMVGMVVGVLARAATTGVVTASVTVQNIAVSLNRSSFAYGSIPANSASSTITLWAGLGMIATNDGSVANFDIYGAHTGTGASGNGWDLATATSTTDNYKHRFCVGNAAACPNIQSPTQYTSLTTSTQTLQASVASLGTVTFELTMHTPNPSTKFTEQSAAVTVQASAP